MGTFNKLAEIQKKRDAAKKQEQPVSSLRSSPAALPTSIPVGGSDNLGSLTPPTSIPVGGSDNLGSLTPPTSIPVGGSDNLGSLTPTGMVQDGQKVARQSKAGTPPPAENKSNTRDKNKSATGGTQTLPVRQRSNGGNLEPCTMNSTPHCQERSNRRGHFSSVPNDFVSNKKVSPVLNNTAVKPDCRQADLSVSGRQSNLAKPFVFYAIRTTQYARRTWLFVFVVLVLAFNIKLLLMSWDSSKQTDKAFIKMAEVKSAVDSTSRKVSDLAVTAKSVTEEVERVASRVDDTDSKLVAASNKIKDIENSTEAQKAAIENLSKAKNTTLNRLSSLEAEIENLKKSVIASKSQQPSSVQ